MSTDPQRAPIAREPQAAPTRAQGGAPATLGDWLALGGERPESAVLSLQRRVGNQKTIEFLEHEATPITGIRPPPAPAPAPAQGAPPAAAANAGGIQDFIPSPAEIEEAAAAMNLPASDPRVREQVASAKSSLAMRRMAPQPEQAPAAPPEQRPADPNDPHQWKREPGESMEQFLERQRKGLLAKELKQLGLTEEQLREQVTKTGTRTEEHVKIGDKEYVTIRQAIPSPDGAVRVITTLEERGKNSTRRSKRVWEPRTDRTAIVVSIVEDDRETIQTQRGDQSLFELPSAAPSAAGAAPAGGATAPEAARRGTPHTRWTRQPNGQVLVEEIDENGQVVPGSGHKVDALQSPQERIKADQARDPNAVWHP